MVWNAINYFGVLDYGIVALTIVISLGIGVYYAFKGRSKRTGEELLMGGRNMAALPIACSMMVTFFSGIGVIGSPAEIYLNGILYFWTAAILALICIPLSAYIFMSVLYKLKLTSVYEYLELRFDSSIVRCLASAMFILQMNIYSGVGLYAPAIALELFLGLPVWVSVLSSGICATVYTSIGGLKAVIWTDVFQLVLILVGLVSILTRGLLTSGGAYEAFHVAHENGRLEFFDFNLDPFQKYNTLNLVLGQLVHLTCNFGIYQPTVQRYSSLPTFRDAIKSMAWYALLKQLFCFLMICTGTFIFATYAGCDPVILGEIKKADQIVPYYFVKELSWIPGMMGVFTTAILSAVLSTVSSNLNSLAAVTWEDFMAKIPYFAKLSSVNKGYITSILCVMYGVVTILLAFLSANLGSILQFTVTVLSSLNGVIGGCFLLGLFVPCANEMGAIFGLLSGLGTTSFLTYKSFEYKVPYATLPNSIDNCPAGTDFSMVVNITRYTADKVEFEWPTKLYTISFVLYPFIAASITILVGTLTSLVSRSFVMEPKRSCSDYLHPLVKRLCSIPDSSSKDQFPNVNIELLNTYPG